MDFYNHDWGMSIGSSYLWLLHKQNKIKQLTKEQHEAICEWIKGNCYTGGLETEEEMNFLVTRFTNQFPPDIKLQKETIKDLKVCKKN